MAMILQLGEFGSPVVGESDLGWRGLGFEPRRHINFTVMVNNQGPIV